MKPLQIVDLFCGAGGTSTGILRACERLAKTASLTAVNHWPTAINTHSLNHPSVSHLCENVENIHPLDLVKSGRLDLLAASCECRFHSNACGIDQPVPTITAHARHLALVEPFIVNYHGNHETKRDGDARVCSLDEPLPTQDTSNRYALVEPFIITTDQVGRKSDTARTVDQPIPTVVTKQNMLLVEPMVVKYYKTGRAIPVSKPLDTVTTKARFMLVEFDGGRAYLDIRTRMLQPHELAAAHSFPKSYQFTGNKEDQTKQIGNSVPVELAAAHAAAVLS